jgi:geranyl diphosphate 2-C-methyltransferase
LIKKRLGCYIQGYTISQGQADFANLSAKKYKISDKVRFFRENMLNLPVKDCHFDLIWACESTEHVLSRDLVRMFGEFARVSKPKTRLVLTAWTSQVGMHKRAKTIKKLIDAHYLTDIHSAKEYVSAAKKAGWKILKKIDISRQSLPYWILREKSKNTTGSEKFFIEGYTNNSLKYYIYVFELK